MTKNKIPNKDNTARIWVGYLRRQYPELFEEEKPKQLEEDLMNSNTKYGWLHYYVAHLTVRCGLNNLGGVINAILQEVEIAKKHRAYYDLAGPYCDQYLSDNGCIMEYNRWFFTEREIVDHINMKALQEWIIAMSNP